MCIKFKDINKEKPPDNTEVICVLIEDNKLYIDLLRYNVTYNTKEVLYPGFCFVDGEHVINYTDKVVKWMLNTELLKLVK